MHQNNCPDLVDLEEYATGVLSAQRAANLEGHLDSCPKCAETMSAVESNTDRLLLRLREQVDVGEHRFLSEVEFRSAVDSICGHDFSGVGIPYPATQSRNREAPRQRDPHIDAMFRPGVRLGQYELQEILGRGGMGVVFRARQLKLNRTVAIKLLSDSRMLQEDTQKRFEREIHAIGQLDHPNIVRALAADDINGVHFLVMEYVPGTDLAKWLKTKGPLSISDACNFVRQAALGLDHIHKNEMVHRDLKPGNLMVTEDGQIKILDLGLALLSDPLAHFSQERTESGQLMGTLDFMAPEQCSDTHAVDIRADIYSLGATLFALLTGQPPFPSDRYPTTLKKLSAIVNETAPDVSIQRPDVSPELAAVIARLLARNPADRYQTPAEVVEAILPSCPSSVPEISRKAIPKTIEVTSALAVNLPLPAKFPGTAVPPGALQHRSTIIVLAAIVVAAMALLIMKEWGGGDIDVSQATRLSVSRQQVSPLPANAVATIPKTQREIAEHLISVGGSVYTSDTSGHGDWRTDVSQLLDVGLVIMGVEFPAGTDVSTAEIEPLTQLRSIGICNIIAHQQLTSEHLKSLHGLRGCDRLRMLVLGTQTSSDINDDDVAALLKNLPDLEHLALFSFSLDGSCLDTIQNPEKITWITMVSPGADFLASDKRVTTLESIRNLQRFTALETLDLSGGELNSEHFRLLPSLPKLKALTIMGIDSVAENLETVLSIPGLERLNLMNTSLTDSQVSVLSTGVRLRQLDLRNNGFTKVGIDRLSQALPKCEFETDFGRTQPSISTKSDATETPN